MSAVGARAVAPARLVAVVGAGDADVVTRAAAEEVGAELARAGAGVVCGGLGGVMEAACRGAARAGGLTVGLLPGDDPEAANPWVAVVIPTGLGEARNTLVARAGRALIAVGGGHGTLSEVAFALKTGRRVVALRSWGLARPDGTREDAVHVATSPADAVRAALA